MLLSIAAIIMFGLLFGKICKTLHFPSLFGMIVAGIIIGPYYFNLIDSSVLNISTEIRRIALIIILIRAGLKLNISELKQVGRPAILLCFVPACFEIIGMIMIAPKVLEISYLDAAILGAVIGAVSPAVIVPRMIKLIDEDYGTKKGIPQMILAGASVDDVFVIVMFTTFTSLAIGQEVSPLTIVKIPVSIIAGIFIGIFVGIIITIWFKHIKMSITIMAVIILSVCFLLSEVETNFPQIPFASLIAVMCLGMAIKNKDLNIAIKISNQYDKLWIIAELFLFVLVGASVSIDHAKEIGISAILLIIIVLLFRMLGVYLCVLGTRLNVREKLFCMIAYTPKATVQAAIGAVPLAMGLNCGELVLTVSVAAILLTAPLGAFGIDLTYKRFLKN